MRKLKLQMQLSLDGYSARPDGALDWMVWEWDDALKDYGNAITAPNDLILLGRKTAEGFIPHWERVAANPQDPEHDFGRLMVDTPKIVFSRTLDTMEGTAVSVLHEASPDAIRKLKAQPGGDIIVYGGVDLVSGLLRKGLIDECHFFVNPVAIGKGMSIFNGLEKDLQLKLVDAKAFTCGVSVLMYRPV